LLGALLTFAPVVLYAGESRELWDQQLAGLVMWIPGGAVYLLATVWVGYQWLKGNEASSQRQIRPA
ncbi:MAG: cytochrome c oxidase assembly protein, partial [Burkholderiaceae bacterium]|nr:cytochrome c oxidase assembly protein [Burkholderiaceae bacterium]